MHGGVDLRLANKPQSVHRRIPSDEALMRMAAYHRAPVPRLPTVMSPPTSPNPSQDLTSIVDAMHEGALRARPQPLCKRLDDHMALLGLLPASPL